MADTCGAIVVAALPLSSSWAIYKSYKVGEVVKQLVKGRWELALTIAMFCNMCMPLSVLAS